MNKIDVIKYYFKNNSILVLSRCYTVYYNGSEHFLSIELPYKTINNVQAFRGGQMFLL